MSSAAPRSERPTASVTHGEVDAVIVGMGWAGSIIGSELAKAGWSVVGLERGQGRNPADNIYRRSHDELRFAVRSDLVQDLSIETWTLRHSTHEVALPIRQSSSFRPGQGVGGSGIAWSGNFWRLKESDFRFKSEISERLGAAAIPNECTLEDWPISYQELEPHYAKFERMIGVSGKAGNIDGRLLEGGNPFEAPRSADYPLPPLKPSASSMAFRKAAADMGLHPFPQPSAILSEAYTNPDGVHRLPCTYCGFCTNHACHVHAKADPVVTVLPVAQASHLFELREESTAFQVVHDSGGASGVLYYDAAGTTHMQPARVVILAAYTLSNVRLLLLSRLGRAYDSVLGTGVVGKNYTYQLAVRGTGFFRDKQFEKFVASPGSADSVDDYNLKELELGQLGFVGAAMISCGARGTPPISGVSVPPGSDTWGTNWKEAIRFWYDRTVGIGASGNCLPYRDAFLDLDPQYRDVFGHPLLRLTFDWKANEQQLGVFLADRLRAIFNAMSADSVSIRNAAAGHYDTTFYQSTHNTGGAIMGSDPEKSVVNKYLQMWDCPNVFVVGASAFPQTPSHAPTATVGALGYMVADAIINKFSKQPVKLW